MLQEAVLRILIGDDTTTKVGFWSEFITKKLEPDICTDLDDIPVY